MNMEVALSFIFGVISSAVVWYVVTHVMKPALTFSEKLVRIDYKDKPRYTVRIFNAGRREVIDVRPIIRLRIKGLLPDISHWKNIDLELDEAKCANIPKKKHGHLDSRGFWFFPGDTEEFSAAYFPDTIKKKKEEGLLTLEDILETGDNAYIIVYVFCYDAWSGVRKLYISNEYRRKNIETRESNVEQLGKLAAFIH